MNLFVISGNLTREPEVKAFPSGKTVINFSIANNDDHRKKDDGTWETIPSFFDVVFWTNRTQHWIQESRLAKGNHVVCHGTIRQQRWDTDGQKRSRVVFKIGVEDDLICSQKKGNQQNPQTETSDDDIPF